MARHLTQGEAYDLVEMLELRMGPQVVEVAERYDISTCTATNLLRAALLMVHARSHCDDVAHQHDASQN